jgi:hypothetical protein
MSQMTRQDAKSALFVFFKKKLFSDAKEHFEDCRNVLSFLFVSVRLIEFTFLRAYTH